MQFSLEDYADVDGGGDDAAAAVVCLVRVFLLSFFLLCWKCVTLSF